MADKSATIWERLEDRMEAAGWWLIAAFCTSYGWAAWKRARHG